MSWFEAIVPLVIALAVVLVPGIPIAAAVGARGISFLALSVASSVSAIAVSAIVTPYLDITWHIYTPFIVSFPIALLGFLLRRRWLRSFPAPHLRDEWGGAFLATLVGILAAALLIAIPLKVAIGMPDWLAQTPDVSYHLNAVRQILDTGNASSLAMNLTSPRSSVAFYPAAWHAIVALVAQLSGAGIVVAANVTTFVIACVIWPTGCVFMVRQIFGPEKLPLILTGVLSAAFAAFPLLLTEYGVLYPYLLGVGLMPIALGSIIMAAGIACRADLEPPGRWLIMCWVLVGVGFAHPSAGLCVIALSIPIAGQVVYTFVRSLHHRKNARRDGALAIALLVAGVAVFGYVWLRAGAGPGASPTHPYQTLSQAFGEALTNGPLERPSAVVASALMIAGIVTALRRRRHIWLIASYLIVVCLFMFVTAWYPGPLRSAMVGIWYNNSPRLAALLPLLAIPFAVLGATALIRWLQRRIRSAHVLNAVTDSRRSALIGVATILSIAVIVPLSQMGLSMTHAEQIVTNAYRFSDHSALLDPNELNIFDIVRKATPKDAVIAGNPWNGSGLVYAYTDRKALFPHIRGAWSDERWEIAEHFTSASPAVCKAIIDFGVTYVLGFGNRYLTPDNPRVKKYPGFNNLGQSSAVTLVAQRGDAKLYKVTACGLG